MHARCAALEAAGETGCYLCVVELEAFYESTTPTESEQTSWVPTPPATRT